MSRILITSIGAGTYNKRDGTGSYRKAQYYLDDREHCIETPFIFEALMSFRSVDKCIFLGTSGSSWHAFYEYISRDADIITTAIPYDEDYSFSLLKLSENPSNPLIDTRQELTQLRQTLGDFCADIVVLNNGVNEDEINENLSILIDSLKSVVEDGDKICFDITHSFRSLALYELVAVNYFKDALGNNVDIEFVSYGMLDFARQNGGLTPIVDLSPITNLIEWTKAAAEYKKFGTLSLLAELIRDNSIGMKLPKEEIKALGRLGNISSFDSIKEFKNLVKNCNNIRRAIENPNIQREENRIFGHIFSEISLRFGDKIEDDVLFYSEIAKWHFECERYHLCAVVLTEGVLNYMASLININRDPDKWSWSKDIEFRSKLSRARSSNSTVGSLLKYYQDVKHLRDKLCHLRPLSTSEISMLHEKAKGLHTMIKDQFRAKESNEHDLKKALETD